jgi:chromosomal replication initiation ATPase DnaA
MKTKHELIEIAANEFGSTPNVIRGKSRTRRASYARDALSYIMHLHGYTHEEISRLVNRNRGSVTHGIKRVKTRIKSEDEINSAYLQALHKACFHAGIHMPSYKLESNEA